FPGSVSPALGAYAGEHDEGSPAPLGQGSDTVGEREAPTIHSTAGVGRVGVWRGGVRLGISVPAPFVWRCLSGSAVAPFPHPSHRTGRADCPHPALGQDVTPSSTA